MPTIFRAIVDIPLLLFLKDEDLRNGSDLRAKHLGMETTLGLIASLVLGPASSLFYGTGDSTSISLGFLSSNFLVLAMCIAVLHMLILQQIPTEEEVATYVKILGRNGVCLTGQVLVLGGALWIVGSMNYLFNQSKSLDSFLWPFCVLIGMAGPITYSLTQSVLNSYYARHQKCSGF